MIRTRSGPNIIFTSLLLLTLPTILISGAEQHALVGTWRLTLSEFRDSHGGTSYPLGKDAVGMLIYDSNGNMAVQLMQQSRPKFLSADRANATAEEFKAAFVGYDAYYGTYTIDTEAKTVTHHVRGSLFPNWVGSDLKRSFEISGKLLYLRTPPFLIGGQQITGVLVWERIE